MKDLNVLIAKEKFSYLCAFVSSLLISFYLLIQFFQNDISLAVIHLKFLTFTLFLLAFGNLIHGYYAFKNFIEIDNLKLNEVIGIKKNFYISLFFNFIIPYNVLVFCFYYLEQVNIALLALLLQMGIIVTCFICDIIPFVKSVKNILKMN